MKRIMNILTSDRLINFIDNVMKIKFITKRVKRLVINNRIHKEIGVYNDEVYNHLELCFNNYSEIRSLCTLYFDVRKYIKPINMTYEKNVISSSIERVITSENQEEIIFIIVSNGEYFSCNNCKFFFNKDKDKSYLELTVNLLNKHESITKTYKLNEIKRNMLKGNDDFYTHLYNYILIIFASCFMYPITEALCIAFDEDLNGMMRKIKFYNSMKNTEKR